MTGLVNVIGAVQGNYFTGFPCDQVPWDSYLSASINNATHGSIPYYSQLLTFSNSTSFESYTIANLYPSATCVVSFDILLGTATSFGYGVFGVGATANINTTTNITAFPLNTTPTGYYTSSLTFTSPPAGTATFNLRCGPGGGGNGVGSGTVNITNVQIYQGATQATLFRGAVTVPFGDLSANSVSTNSINCYNDILYGNGQSLNALTAQLTNYQPLNPYLTAIGNYGLPPNAYFMGFPQAMIAFSLNQVTTTGTTYQVFNFTSTAGAATNTVLNTWANCACTATISAASGSSSPATTVVMGVYNVGLMNNTNVTLTCNLTSSYQTFSINFISPPQNIATFLFIISAGGVSTGLTQTKINNYSICGKFPSVMQHPDQRWRYDVQQRRLAHLNHQRLEYVNRGHKFVDKRHKLHDKRAVGRVSTLRHHIYTVKLAE